MRIMLMVAGAFLAGCGGDDADTADRAPIQLTDAATQPTADAGPDLPEECDTTAQDCNVAGYKCTIIATTPTDPETEFETECVPEGTVAESDSCLRTPPKGNASVGHDNCLSTFCSGVGFDSTVDVPMRRCRHFCDADGDCPVTGERCLSFDGTGPLEGFCLPSCAVLTAGECDPGFTCSLTVNNDNANWFGYCRTTGAGGHNTPCASDSECQADMNCFNIGTATTPNLRCLKLCDPANVCPAAPAATCEPFDGLPADTGACIPN